MERCQHAVGSWITPCMNYDIMSAASTNHHSDAHSRNDRSMGHQAHHAHAHCNFMDAQNYTAAQSPPSKAAESSLPSTPVADNSSTVFLDTWVAVLGLAATAEPLPC